MEDRYNGLVEAESLPPPLPGAPAAQGPPRLWPHALLLAATFCTTAAAGSYLAHFDSDFRIFWASFKYRPEWILDGLAFAIPLMAILISHELGHYILSRHHGVDSSLPYFIPGPNLIGTFGAVILMKSRVPDRRALFDIGAAGPLAGLAVAVFTMIAGLLTARTQWFFPAYESKDFVLFHPNFLLMISSAVFPSPPPPEALGALPGAIDAVPLLNSPLIDAACVGFLVTMLNLMPIGQLDGGHVAYAVFGKQAAWLNAAAIIGLLLMGLAWIPWFGLLFILLALMGRKAFTHPPTLDPEASLGTGRILLAVLVFILFIMILSPEPVSVYISQ